jgi:hypothetical protein
MSAPTTHRVNKRPVLKIIVDALNDRSVSVVRLSPVPLMNNLLPATMVADPAGLALQTALPACAR